MTEFISYIWICICISGFVLKILTYSNYYYAVSAASIVLFVFSLFKVAPRIQMVLFAALTFAFALTVKIVMRVTRRMKRGSYYTGTVVGKPAMVTEEINNRGGTGAVKLNGVEWRAVSGDDEETIPAGCVVNILACGDDVLTCEYY